MVGRSRGGLAMEGVREYAEHMPVVLKTNKGGREVIEALNEGGYNGVEIDLLDLVEWIKKHRPELGTAGAADMKCSNPTCRAEIPEGEQVSVWEIVDGELFVQFLCLRCGGGPGYVDVTEEVRTNVA